MNFGLIGKRLSHSFSKDFFTQKFKKLNYKRAIYFDTFPDHSGLDPIKESSTNIKTFKKLNKIADKLTNNPDLNDAISNQNASKSFNIIQEYLFK